MRGETPTLLTCVYHPSGEFTRALRECVIRLITPSVADSRSELGREMLWSHTQLYARTLHDGNDGRFWGTAKLEKRSVVVSAARIDILGAGG